MDVIVNEQIHSLQVRLIDENGKQLGIVLTRHALDQAHQLGMDLVLVADGEPPVCRIVHASKWLYQRKKNEKAAAKRQRESAVLIKEVQLRPVITANDLGIKSRKAREWLAEGDKVKIIVKFRGRESSHKERGKEVIVEFLNGLGEHKIERPIADGGNNLTLLVAPAKSKADLHKEAEKSLE